MCISDCVFAFVCAGVFTFLCGGLPEGSLCAGVLLERQMSRADILGRPGSGQSFIWAEMILALRFGALTQEQCHPPPSPNLPSFFLCHFVIFSSLLLLILSSPPHISPVFVHLWLTIATRLERKRMTGEKRTFSYAKSVQIFPDLYVRFILPFLVKFRYNVICK